MNTSQVLLGIFGYPWETQTKCSLVLFLSGSMPSEKHMQFFRTLESVMSIRSHITCSLNSIEYHVSFHTHTHTQPSLNSKEHLKKMYLNPRHKYGKAVSNIEDLKRKREYLVMIGYLYLLGIIN